MADNVKYSTTSGKVMYRPTGGKVVYSCAAGSIGFDCADCDTGTVPAVLMITLPGDMEDAETRYGAFPTSDGCSNCADINGMTFVCNEYTTGDTHCRWHSDPLALGGNCTQAILDVSLISGTLAVELQMVGGNHGGAITCSMLWTIGSVSGDCATNIDGLSVPVDSTVSGCGPPFTGCASAGDNDVLIAV